MYLININMFRYIIYISYTLFQYIDLIDKLFPTFKAEDADVGAAQQQQQEEEQATSTTEQPGTEEAKAKEEEPDRASKYNLQRVNLKELTKGDKPVRKKKRPDSMKSKDADHDHKKGEESDEEEEGLTVCCIRYIEVARDREGGEEEEGIAVCCIRYIGVGDMGVDEEEEGITVCCIRYIEVGIGRG